MAPARDQDLPLTGLRVLEFSHTVMRPTAGLVLADLGADVVKVEPAPAGDATRLPRLPIELGGRRSGLRRQPPRLGEHTREILTVSAWAWRRSPLSSAAAS
jgi:crotonobetainyl-CoA:carnitine CoA-transferase CaiB-like acyl-CoA transferase